MRAAIATTTFSKTIDLRSRLAIRTAQEAQQYGYPIAVVDGGSAGEFREKLLACGVLLFDQATKGMGSSRRQAMSEAAKIAGDNGVVIWMEPEKHTFVSELHKVVKPIQSDEVDIVVPARKSLSSYPPEQEHAERIGNLAFKYLFGRELDPWFGPRAMNQKALGYFLAYQGEYGDKWDSIFIPVLRAMKDGLRVKSVEVDYVHPHEQTAEETGKIDFLLKWVEQLLNLIPALQHEAEKLGIAAA